MIPKVNLVNQATEVDLVQHNFTVDRPNALWLTDLTRAPDEGGQGSVLRSATSRDVGTDSPGTPTMTTIAVSTPRSGHGPYRRSMRD
jgi:hypothetical protein